VSVEEMSDRGVELEDFAYYCRSLRDVGPASLRELWTDRAEWAEACAVDFRRLEDEVRELRAALERYRERMP
jgi:hypothetical protein